MSSNTLIALVALPLAVAGGACAEASTTSVPWTPPSTERPVLPATYRPSGHQAAGDVFVHLFEWPWSDVATECEATLGPAGYDAVQVSPPQEHALIAGFPWWQRYQPVGHSVARSRSGTEAAFRDMVARCGAAGVDVYVDAVINHMTAGAGTGSNGTTYTKYAYPGLFTTPDFHGACTVSDYQSAANVQDCELLGLADLHTGRAEVREKLAAYLLALVRMGVSGFRIDAAKHIQPVELDAILDVVNATAAAEGRRPPYVFAEVIDHGGEAVRASDYFGLGHGTGGAADITEFRFRGTSEKFAGSRGQKVSELRGFSAASWGLMPSDKAVVFIENHDTQREGGQLGYRNAALYRLANVWMLAQPYGYPKVMSSYAFDLGRPGGRDAGPPSDAGGATLPVRCAASLEVAAMGDWVCEHRDPVIAAMVRFREVVAGTDLRDSWDNGGHALAFSRGDRGFVALNGESVAQRVEVATSLPPGTYCDALTGGVHGGACRGRSVQVTEAGRVAIDVPAREAVALHVGARR